MDKSKNNQYRLIFCLIMGVILLVSQVANNVYISKNFNKDYIPNDINNNEVVNSYFNNSIFMVKTARGYYGILNSNGSEIISPIWNSIEVLSPDRFVVGRVLNSASVSVGILDDYENIIVPLIFNSISQENDYFKVGTLKENGKKILFDSFGNIQFDKAWDTCEIDGNTAKVTKDNLTAVVTAESNGKCSYSSIYFPSSILGKDFSVTVKNPIFDGISALDDYQTVVNGLSKYCEAIFNSDTDSIREVTNSQYYNSLISNMLPNCKLSHVSNISVYGEKDDTINGAVVYYAEIRLSYTSNTSVIENSSAQEMNIAQLKLEFVRSQEGNIVLRSAEKILNEPKNQDENLEVSTTSFEEFY